MRNNKTRVNNKNLTVQDVDNLHLLFQAKCGFQISYDNQKISIIAGGMATTRQVAIKKAESEFVERICAIYQSEKLIRGTVKSLGTKYKLAPFTNYYYWVNGKTFDGKSRVLMPAHIVFIKFIGEKTKNLLPVDGSGLASHKTLDKAKIHGLLEVIERDQISLFWDVAKAKASIVVQWENKISGKIVEFVRKLSYKSTVLYLDEFQKEKVYTFVVLLENTSGNITVGTASSLDAKIGLEKAILEAITLQETVKLTNWKKTKTDKTSISHVLYAYQNSRLIKSYIDSKIERKINFSNIPENIDKRFNYKNLEKKFHSKFYYYKFPRSPKNQAAVRVVIPTAHRKSNTWPVRKLQRIDRLAEYINKFNSQVNKTIPHPYG